MTSSLLAKSNNLLYPKTEFPNIVFTKNGAEVPASDTFAIADYNQNSIVIYTTREFQEKYRSYLDPLAPIYNHKLKISPSNTNTNPGLVFKKSDPRVAELINFLSGEDIFSKITKQPDYNNKFNKFNNNNNQSNTNNSTLPPLIPSSTPTVVKSNEPVDPLQNFQDLFFKLSEPLLEVREKKLSHPLGESLVGFIGPAALVDQQVNLYLDKYQDYNVTVDAELTIKQNKAVLISRLLIN